jgi:hypothetical protein
MAVPLTRSNREIRDLAALQRSGSSSRVLNLSHLEGCLEPDYAEQPFFLNRTLNTSIIVKHRVRGDERYLFDHVVTNATKVIVPFCGSDLSLGGRSLFVGQRSWREMLDDLCAAADLERDGRILQLMDQLPSLDPFLLREHLKRHGFEIGRSYFAITPGDYERMQQFVKREISRLIELAFSNSRTAAADTGKLVEALLSSRVDERFEPLRRTLGLEGEAYREGVFCWKGFLYYKWVLSDLWPKVEDVLHELRHFRISGPRDKEIMRAIEHSRSRLALAIHSRRREVAETLQVYDNAFRDLTENGDPGTFRAFLVQAPSMFTSLGERIGGLSHIASFWRYCVPTPNAKAMAADELLDMLQDFEASLGVDELREDAPALRAAG